METHFLIAQYLVRIATERAMTKVLILHTMRGVNVDKDKLALAYQEKLRELVDIADA